LPPFLIINGGHLKPQFTRQCSATIDTKLAFYRGSTTISVSITSTIVKIVVDGLSSSLLRQPHQPLHRPFTSSVRHRRR
jgi:hypothetical protein